MYLLFHQDFYILAKNVILAGIKVSESICTKPFSLQHILWREIIVVGPEGLILKGRGGGVKSMLCRKLWIFSRVG